MVNLREMARASCSVIYLIKGKIPKVLKDPNLKKKIKDSEFLVNMHLYIVTYYLKPFCAEVIEEFY